MTKRWMPPLRFCHARLTYLPHTLSFQLFLSGHPDQWLAMLGAALWRDTPVVKNLLSEQQPARNWILPTSSA